MERSHLSSQSNNKYASKGRSAGSKQYQGLKSMLNKYKAALRVMKFLGEKPDCSSHEPEEIEKGNCPLLAKLRYAKR